MKGTRVAGWLSMALPWALPVTGLVQCALAVSLAGVTLIVVTTYSAVSDLAAAADVGAGLALVAASGVGLALGQPGSRSRRLGVLLGVLALTWLGHDVVGWRDGPGWARSLGLVLVPFTLPLIAHVAQVARPVLVFGYAAAGVYSLGRALFRDPFRDVNCWSNCSVNSFLITPLPGFAEALDAAWRPASALLALVVAGLCVRQLWRATPTARRAGMAILAPAGAAATAAGLANLLLLWRPVEDPRSPWFVTTFLLQAVTLAALGLGVMVWTARAASTRRELAQLVRALESPEPGGLGSSLARSLGDPDLTVAYRLPGRDHLVDAAGQAVVGSPGPDQEETVIARGGQPVAALWHDRGVPLASDLERAIGPAIRLALDIERLRAQVLAHLMDLRSARTRIVRTGDDTRRRIERNLHDGAQQRLLRVAYDLRLAAAAARTAGDEQTREAAGSAATTVQAAFGALRDLAHGIFPAVLTESGLHPALRALAARAPLPVEIDAEADARFPPDVESAVYFAVADAVTGAQQRGATFVAARIRRVDASVQVTIEDDGTARPDDAILPTTDRVSALGGSVAVDGAGLQAVIPCES